HQGIPIALLIGFHHDVSPVVDKGRINWPLPGSAITLLPSNIQLPRTMVFFTLKSIVRPSYGLQSEKFCPLALPSYTYGSFFRMARSASRPTSSAPLVSWMLKSRATL